MRRARELIVLVNAERDRQIQDSSENCPMLRSPVSVMPLPKLKWMANPSLLPNGAHRVVNKHRVVCRQRHPIAISLRDQQSIERTSVPRR